MEPNFRKNCAKCGKPGIEVFLTLDGPEDDVHCPKCNDRLIEKANEQREWDHYHKGGS